MPALITKRKRPRVKIVAGSVSIIRSGFTIASSKDKTIATITAEPKSVISTPGKIISSIKTFTEQTNTLKNHFCIASNYN
jgi:hypothetical protein